MQNRLYVGGISFNTSQNELSDAFSQAGTVTSAMIVMDRVTGRSKGFGFVDMSNEEEAQAAIDMWNGKELGGRRLTVNIARPREERPARRFDGDRGDNRF